jgi:hypothetical protein
VEEPAIAGSGTLGMRSSLIPALKGRHTIPGFACAIALTAASPPAALPIRKVEPLDRLGRPGPYCVALQGWIRVLLRTQDFVLGFAVPPFQGWIRVLLRTQDFVLGFAVPPFQGWILGFDLAQGFHRETGE